MRRTLLCLLPWMVAAAVAQEAARPAEVQLANYAPAQAWRVGDECWVSPRALIGWKWPYSFVGDEATIQAEGRTIRVNGKSIQTRFLLPLGPILEQLGASAIWDKDRDVLYAAGSIRSVTVKDGTFVVHSTLPFEPKVMWMDGPGRIVVDIKGARLPENASLDLDVKARAAQHDPTTVRIVLETDTKPLVPDFQPGRSFEWSLAATPTENAKPITEIPKAEPPKTVAAPLAALSMIEVAQDGVQGATLTLRTSVPLPAPAQMRRIDPLTIEVDLPKVARPESLTLPASPSFTVLEAVPGPSGTTIRIVTERPMGLKLTSLGAVLSLQFIKPKVGDGKLAGKVVVVDAGHGDHDPGARAPDKSVNEKTLTLAISKLVAAELTAHGASVIMTRDTDTFVALKERAEIANRNNADFFISVHINSNRTNDSTSGSITFHHGGSVTGQLLAECLQNEIKQIPGIPGIGVWSDTRIYSTGFAVLRYSKMPAVLLELGFINHSRDRKRLQEKDYQIAVAKAVAKGLRVYLGDVKP